MIHNGTRPKPTPTQPNIAVLIDAENINHIESIQSLIADLQEFGQIVVKRAIGDWDRTIGVVRDPFVDLGFELVHQPNLAPGSNLADVRLVIEAIELLHNRNFDVETYAVVSSDQDFLPLYDRLRELGKTVIVAGDAHSNFTRLDETRRQYSFPSTTLSTEDIRHSVQPTATLAQDQTRRRKGCTKTHGQKRPR